MTPALSLIDPLTHVEFNSQPAKFGSVSTAVQRPSADSTHVPPAADGGVETCPGVGGSPPENTGSSVVADEVVGGVVPAGGVVADVTGVVVVGIDDVVVDGGGVVVDDVDVDVDVVGGVRVMSDEVVLVEVVEVVSLVVDSIDASGLVVIAAGNEAPSSPVAPEAGATAIRTAAVNDAAAPRANFDGTGFLRSPELLIETSPFIALRLRSEAGNHTRPTSVKIPEIGGLFGISWEQLTLIR